MVKPAYTVNSYQYELTDAFNNISSCTTLSSGDVIELNGIGIDNNFYSFSGTDVPQLREWVTQNNFILKIFTVKAEFKENFGAPIPHTFDWVVTARQYLLKDTKQEVYVCTVKDNEPIELGGIGNDNLYYGFSGNNVSELYSWAYNLGMEVYDFSKTVSYRIPREEDKRLNVEKIQIF